jgi:hypothetical protein
VLWLWVYDPGVALRFTPGWYRMPSSGHFRRPLDVAGISRMHFKRDGKGRKPGHCGRIQEDTRDIDYEDAVSDYDYDQLATPVVENCLSNHYCET